MLSSRFPAFSSRNFRIFWIGQFVSLIGTWMQSTTQPYLAYRLTDSPIYLGLLGFASSLPALIVTLPIGVYIERLDKRKVIIAMQMVMMVQAFILAYLALTDQITIWHMVFLSFILGIASIIDAAGRQSMLVELVDRETIPNAISLNSAAFNTARIIGPSLAAPFLVLIGHHGEGWAFVANGISYLFVLVGLFMINTKSIIPSTQHGKTFMSDFVDGQKYIRRTNLVWLLILMVTIPGFFGFTFMQQIPVFARDVLATVADTEALVATRNSLLVTFMGVGALIAALSLAFFSNIRRKGLVLAIGQVVFAVGLVTISQSTTMGTALIMITLIGWGMVTELALTNTLIQLTVPDQLRGRVISTYLWAMQGLAPFGSLFLGWLVQELGAQTAVLICGSIILVLTLGIHLFNSTIRGWVPEDQESQEPAVSSRAV